MVHGIEQIKKMNEEATPALHYWREPAVPRHVVQMLVVDPNGHILVMHRSDKVKSAKNVWSIPTGTHEIGESIQSCIVRELYEEFNLIAERAFILEQYENIAGDISPPHYHWVLSIYAILVKDVKVAVNKEPELHDQMIFPNWSTIDDQWFKSHQFHPSLHTLISKSLGTWLNMVAATLQAINKGNPFGAIPPSLFQNLGIPHH
jgi:ADP-ribose pyrophosphatase YjhB (NUDIX family)